jgi:hypothetical protein
MPWPVDATTYEELRDFLAGPCGMHPMELIHQALLDAWFEFELVRYEDRAAILRAARRPVEHSLRRAAGLRRRVQHG